MNAYRSHGADGQFALHSAAMRIRAARVLIPLVLLLVVVAFVLIWRVRSQVVYGPMVALCPGPDRYGYTCEGAAAFALSLIHISEPTRPY